MPNHCFGDKIAKVTPAIATVVTISFETPAAARTTAATAYTTARIAVQTTLLNRDRNLFTS
jgi:hypothetical protein